MQGNGLLSALTSGKNKLGLAFYEVYLERGKVLCEAGSVGRYVYFPLSCVVSFVAVSAEGQGVETALVGSEGLCGVATSWLGQPSFTRCVVQIEGAAVRFSAADFRRELRSNEALRRIVITHSEAVLAQVQQGVLCAALHTIEQRLCRWLLMIRDRVAAQPLPLTQEFLAGMLAANRGSVTVAAKALQTAGLIKYSRGSIMITDHAGLERAACECYRTVTRHCSRLVARSAQAIA